MNVPIAILAAAAALPAQVVLRNGELIGQPPASVNVRGVAFADQVEINGVFGGVIGWDRVRSVGGDVASAAEPWMGVADSAWRARTRLERGDAAGAEPLFERLFAEYRGRSGPTAAMIAQGLLVCRLYRGAQLSAIGPWLSWLRCGTPATPLPSMIDLSRTPGPGSAGVAVAPDEGTGLIPQLPPIFMDTPALHAFAQAEENLAISPEEEAGPLEGRAQALWSWYRFAARTECGLEAHAPDTAGADDATLFVSEIVMARAGSPQLRDKARAALRNRLDGARAPWIEAWCRAGIGRSLVLAQSPDDRLLGVLELLHVPARLADQSSYLTGLALAEASVALKDVGDTAGADRLHAELLDRFAGHPATDWTPVRAWPVAPSGAPATAEKEGN